MVSVYTLYHNPRCSNSRKTLEILQHHQIYPIIVDYLKTPLPIDELLDLRRQFELEEFVRTNEPLFKQLNLSLENETNVLQAMLKAPILMQRPIVIYAKKALIARPPEKVLEFIRN